MTVIPSISLEGATFTYAGADAPALDEINLSVARGECVILGGASGSGKSTTLRLMNGLVPHLLEGTMTGRARIGDDDLCDLTLAEAGRRSGSVWQHPYRQFFATQVCDELAFALENHAEPPQRIRRRIEELLGEHDLGGLHGRALRHLSSGQQQLVATLAAVAHRPPVLLLDEPTANLDDHATARLVAMLARLREEGTTIVIAEHRIGPFLPIADRIIGFRAARIHARWTPNELERLTDDELRENGLRPALPDRSLQPDDGCHARAARSPEQHSPTARKSKPTAVVSDSTKPARSTGSSAGLQLRQIRVDRRGRVVLDLPAAYLPAGRVTVVRGANGAGKTTLARVIAGLERHAGSVHVDGTRRSRTERRRRTMLLTQEVQRQLFAETLTAELDLASSPSATPAPSEMSTDIDGRQTLLARLALDRLTDRHPLSLSGGQQQRLAVAVAHLSNRPVVILDEPSTGVDGHHLDTISALITELAGRGSAVMLISHDEHLVSRTADHEITIRRPQ